MQGNGATPFGTVATNTFGQAPQASAGFGTGFGAGAAAPMSSLGTGASSAPFSSFGTQAKPSGSAFGASLGTGVGTGLGTGFGTGFGGSGAKPAFGAPAQPFGAAAQPFGAQGAQAGRVMMEPDTTTMLVAAKLIGSVSEAEAARAVASPAPGPASSAGGAFGGSFGTGRATTTAGSRETAQTPSRAGRARLLKESLGSPLESRSPMNAHRGVITQNFLGRGASAGLYGGLYGSGLGASSRLGDEAREGKRGERGARGAYRDDPLAELAGPEGPSGPKDLRGRDGTSARPGAASASGAGAAAPGTPERGNSRDGERQQARPGYGEAFSASPASPATSAPPALPASPASPPAAQPAGINPLAPRLASREYVTTPPMSQLVLLPDEELRELRGFSIERPSCGRIEWLGPVDLRGVDLDQAVQLGSGLMGVYDRGAAPPRGEKLNCPARISLYGVHKLDEATGLPVYDTAVQEHYEAAIAQATSAQGAQLVSYDYASGVWCFRVDHFA